MASRWQAVKCLWMLARKVSKQLIELPELPQPESAGQLWLTVRVVQPNATAWSEAGHISAPAAMASGGKNLSVTLPSASHAIPQLTTSETDFCIELGNKRWQFNRQSGFLSQMWIGDEKQLLTRCAISSPVRRWITTLA